MRTVKNTGNGGLVNGPQDLLKCNTVSPTAHFYLGKRDNISLDSAD